MSTPAPATSSLALDEYALDKDWGRDHADHENARCCDCETVRPFTLDSYLEWICDKCEHTRCDACTRYDDDGHSVLSDDDDEEEGGERQYRCHDDEADEATARVGKADCPVARRVRFLA